MEYRSLAFFAGPELDLACPVLEAPVLHGVLVKPLSHQTLNQFRSGI
jgi:hypothetical protein